MFIAVAKRRQTTHSKDIVFLVDLFLVTGMASCGQDEYCAGCESGVSSVSFGNYGCKCALN